MGAKSSASISEAEFAKAMAAFAPFETTPTIAVAVSGGRDSMALALLANQWAVKQGGKLIALTVDHGLREESKSEAEQVKAWMTERGISHQTLNWQGVKPKSGLQEKARTARYRLLEDCCRENNILHLLLGHHLGDQKETHLLRKGKGSGPDGLAAMSPIVWSRQVRLLRPLLGFARERILPTLESQGQSWVDDPSNDDPRFERVRIRQSKQSVDENFSKLAEARRQREWDLASHMAKSVFLHPLGYAELEPERCRADLGRVMSRLVMTIGGRAYGPNKIAIADLIERGEGTLGGCLVQKMKDGKILIFREQRNLPSSLSQFAKTAFPWDGRFKITGVYSGRISPLGERGMKQLKQADAVPPNLPRQALLSLPARWDEKGLLEVPLLGYIREEGEKSVEKRSEMTFSPTHPLLGIGLRLA